MSEDSGPPVLLDGVQRELLDAAQRQSGGEHKSILRLRGAAIVATAVILLTPPSSAALTASTSAGSLFSQTVANNV